MLEITDLLLIGIALLLIILIYKIQILTRSQAALLHSVDKEVFHIAQEQNPSYGLCDSCGIRTYVKNVVIKGQKQGKSPDIFFCKACWWLSDSAELGDEELEYKNRKTEHDVLAAKIGPR